MENKCLKSELDWIDSHPQYYYDDQHREDVKHNITVNYEIRAVEGELNALRNGKIRELELRVAELKSQRREIDPKYISIKCPPIPDTTDELKAKYGDRWYLHITPGRVENTGIKDTSKESA